MAINAAIVPRNFKRCVWHAESDDHFILSSPDLNVPLAQQFGTDEGHVPCDAQIKRDLGGITPKMLTQQLRELERDGLIVRTVYPEVPPRVEYSLSDFGNTLRPVLHTLAAWGVDHREGLMRAIKRQHRGKAAA
jgi:hypothetical protein